MMDSERSIMAKEEKIPTKEKDTVMSETMPIENDKEPSSVLKDKISNSEIAINSLLSKLPSLDKHFNVHKKIGEGTFSNVYLASLKSLNNDKQFAIKHLVPTCHPKRIQYELDCLDRIGGKDNVVSCDMMLRKADCVVFVMPYLAHQRFADYCLDMDVAETRLYMKNLFLALRRVHSFNIIHRDVKPSNFLYNRDSKKFLLVDFGLAQNVDKKCSDDTKVPVTKSLTNVKTPVMKRKREDDDLENTETPAVKRQALQTLPNDLQNKQPLGGAGMRFTKQPLSVQQRKGQAHLAHLLSAKRQPLTSTMNASNVINNNSTTQSKQTFQTLAPQKTSPIDKGSSFVRVQNSQVQPGALFPRPVAPVRRREQCECDGKPQICNLCITRKPQYAPRAGTPGYRPPEVLLKYPHQTTAVDMWSAGVIMLCILSGCYPFFRSPDDITALTELISVFGAVEIKKIAKKLGRTIICQEERKPLSLWLLCENLRRRKVEGTKPDPSLPTCNTCLVTINPENGCLCESRCKLDVKQSFYPPLAYDLLGKLLDLNAETRITAEQALQHPFIVNDVNIPVI